jgi:excinuclease UvrABC nuclease subunit
VVYRIKTGSGSPNYVGSAKKGNVRERISDHLGEIPGVKVQIEQFHSIKEAEKKESNVIERSKPTYNIKGK